jgi:hypothetical protein
VAGDSVNDLQIRLILVLILPPKLLIVKTSAFRLPSQFLLHATAHFGLALWAALQFRESLLENLIYYYDHYFYNICIFFGI